MPPTRLAEGSPRVCALADRCGSHRATIACPSMAARLEEEADIGFSFIFFFLFLKEKNNNIIDINQMNYKTITTIFNIIKCTFLKQNEITFIINYFFKWVFKQLNSNKQNQYTKINASNILLILKTIPKAI